MYRFTSLQRDLASPLWKPRLTGNSLDAPAEPPPPNLIMKHTSDEAWRRRRQRRRRRRRQRRQWQRQRRRRRRNRRCDDSGAKKTKKKKKTMRTRSKTIRKRSETIRKRSKNDSRTTQNASQPSRVSSKFLASPRWAISLLIISSYDMKSTKVLPLEGDQTTSRLVSSGATLCTARALYLSLTSTTTTR